MKIKIRLADKLFSNYVRTRDNWTCQRCRRKFEPGSQGLHCSHFWGRGRENTRFDPDNADALCFGCHQLWGHGDGREEYIRFKTQQLTEEGYKKLKIRAFQYRKKDDKLAIMFITQLNEDLRKVQKGI